MYGQAQGAVRPEDMTNEVRLLWLCLLLCRALEDMFVQKLQEWSTFGSGMCFLCFASGSFIGPARKSHSHAHTITSRLISSDTYKKS